MPDIHYDRVMWKTDRMIHAYKVMQDLRQWDIVEVQCSRKQEGTPLLKASTGRVDSSQNIGALIVIRQRN